MLSRNEEFPLMVIYGTAVIIRKGNPSFRQFHRSSGINKPQQVLLGLVQTQFRSHWVYWVYWVLESSESLEWVSRLSLELPKLPRSDRRCALAPWVAPIHCTECTFVSFASFVFGFHTSEIRGPTGPTVHVHLVWYFTGTHPTLWIRSQGGTVSGLFRLDEWLESLQLRHYVWQRKVGAGSLQSSSQPRCFMCLKCLRCLRCLRLVTLVKSVTVQ
mmetsp:Transcript_54206/g.118657  ORF Transcript_54206/g.118657 Transcript_54206/m.118657 type:complete len:215 (-) Transcript_54206:652-1296(-)